MPPPTSHNLQETYRTVNRALLAALVAAGGLMLARVRYAPRLPAWMTTCGSLRLFHTPCPFCGISRGLAALLRGDPAEAAAWNPLTPWVAAGFTLELLARTILSITVPKGPSLPKLVRLDRRLHLALATLYVLYAALYYAAG